MFTDSGDANLVGSGPSVPALFSPIIAETGIEPIVLQVPTLDILSAPEQGFYPTEDIGYNCDGQTVTLQGTNHQSGHNRAPGSSFNSPKSFCETHSLLDGVYNSFLPFLDPCAIGGKDLENVARRAGLSMEEVLCWFEDEKSRRTKRLSCQFVQPQQPPQQLPMSPAATTTSGLNRTVDWNISEFGYLFPGTPMQLDEHFPLLFPATPSEDHVPSPRTAKRGRPLKNKSLTPSVSPSPKAKRQKPSVKYPCTDCSNQFAVDRWSEHVKRSHFPDHIWECQNMNGRTGKPCKEKVFFRQDNFVTHLKGEHGCTNEDIFRLKIACKLPLVTFFHEKCGFIGCDDTFKNRDESIEHIKEHFRQFSQSSDPPEDLGASQWTHNCASKHTLKRGVHYLVTQGVDHNNSEEDQDQDDNNENGSDNPNSSNQSQNNSRSCSDDGSPPGEEDNSPDPAGFESSQYSSNMQHDEHSAAAPQIGSESEINPQNSEHNFGLENFVLPFTICRRLGSGGHGLVDEVFTVSSIETFARKSVLRKGRVYETSAQMLHLKNELSILKELSHPHLTKLIGAYADAKCFHIIMSPVAEQNLADYLHSTKSSQQPHLLRWMRCLSSSMVYLHSRGIQHLDVKPQNILRKGENVLLTDFGTAKSLNSSPLGLGTLAVTPMYCAPETMLHGQQEFGSDIFSLGCVFSEMMTRHSGSSILEFEKFRSKSGKNAFHSTVSEVITWMALLPGTITSNRTTDDLAGRETRFREKIIQMLAEVSSDRPKASELQSCFMDMDCHLCKSYTAGFSTASSAVMPEHESSFSSRSVLSSGSDSNSTEDITPVPISATNISKTAEIGHINDSPAPNPAQPKPASPLSQPLENTNLSTQLESPDQQSFQSRNLSSENASLENAEKDDRKCRECGKVFSDMEVEAHMLTHRNERLQKCPTCNLTFIDGLYYHEHLGKYTFKDICECHEGSPVNIQPAEQAKTNVTGSQTPPNVIHRSNTQIVKIDGVDVSPARSFLEEHVRYTQSSNGHSVESSRHLGDSTLGDSWTHSSRFTTNREAVDDCTTSNILYDQYTVFSGLDIPEPRTVYKPYELVPHWQSPMVYSESMSNNYILRYQPVSSQDNFKNPWTPIDNRLPAYPQGYVAFAASPGTKSCFYAEHSSAKQLESSQLRKEKSDSGGWEHIVIAKGGLQRISEYNEVESSRRSVTRKGRLDSSVREKAHQIPKLRACWNCWIQKVPCSEGETCKRCREKFSPRNDQLCSRSGFKDFESVFFPEFMHAHLRKSRIEDLISEHTTGFLNTTINAEVLTGSIFKPMRVHTNYFKPQTSKLLQQPILTPAEGNQALQLVQYDCVPLGILALSLSDMGNKCKNHIEDMVSNSKYAAQATFGDKSTLPNQILEIVCEYSAAKKSPLLRNVLKLHAIHYFMSSHIIFSDKTANEVLSIYYFPSPRPPYLSSRLLNRQLKYVMHKLHRKITLLVLEDLERSLRSRTKDSWGPSFCTILIICLCIEKLQSAAETMICYEILKKGESAAFTRNHSYNACLELEKYPFNQFKKLFHEIYKTHKSGGADRGRRGEKGFNPLKTAAEEGTMGLDVHTEGMVRAIYAVMCTSRLEITELSERSTMTSLGRTDIDLGDIMVNNSGRLAAIFLKSFFLDA